MKSDNEPVGLQLMDISVWACSQIEDLSGAYQVPNWIPWSIALVVRYDERVTAFIITWIIAVLSHSVSAQSLKGEGSPQRPPSQIDKLKHAQRSGIGVQRHISTYRDCNGHRIHPPVLLCKSKNCISKFAWYFLSDAESIMSGGLGKRLTDSILGVQHQILGSLNLHPLAEHTNF